MPGSAASGEICLSVLEIGACPSGWKSAGRLISQSLISS